MAYPERPGRSSTAGHDVVFVAVSALAGVGVAFPAAWIWLQLADPPTGQLTKTGITLGEVQLNQRSEVTLWFLAVGFVAGLVAGIVVGWLGRRRGIVAVVAVVVLSAVGAALTAFLGIHLFGPDEKAEAAAASVGDSITSRLTVDTDLAYLGWPIGGVVGACLAILCWPEPTRDAWRSSASSPLVVDSPPPTRGVS